jgi:protein-L-isoaspartate(D-aspartate) O-methyltransferase
MVDRQIARRGVKDARVLAAMREVPRHRFVPDAVLASAYADCALPIGQGQTISQPYIVALMTEALQLQVSDRVLEIGTGSGYQAAILSRLVETVYTIERHQPLAERAQEVLRELGYDNVRFRIGDGTAGWPEEAPFDAVIITAAAPEVPRPLLEQLSDGGRLVAPIGPAGYQDLLVIHKAAQRTTTRQLCPVAFVPLVGDFGWPEEDQGGWARRFWQR